MKHRKKKLFEKEVTIPYPSTKLGKVKCCGAPYLVHQSLESTKTVFGSKFFASIHPFHYARHSRTFERFNSVFLWVIIQIWFNFGRIGLKAVNVENDDQGKCVATRKHTFVCTCPKRNWSSIALKGCFNWSTSPPMFFFAVYWLHWLKLHYVCTLRPFLDLPDLVSFLRERSLSWKQLISINIWLKANFGKWS